MTRYCLWVFFLSLCNPACQALHCTIATAHTPLDAESAYLHADYEKAASLYRTQLQQRPNDPDTTAGLVRVLLRQQKVDEAVDVAKKGLSSDSKSVPIMVALAEAKYRAGAPWQSAALGNEAYKIDPCNAQLYLLMGRLARLDSMYATSANDFRTAHTLDPHDPTIRRMWIMSLPAAQRVIELQTYLAAPNGDDSQDTDHLTKYLERLKKDLATPSKACRLISAVSSTEIPFVPITEGMNHFRAFGLGIKVNDHDWRLQIDTGASGLLVSREVAQRAGLKPLATEQMSGVGSAGSKNGYTAYADSIQIGSFEFHDCLVHVLDASSVVGTDGLIGMDVFSNFLVTLDYPMRKLALGPLPVRPEDTAPDKPSLSTGGGSEDEVVDASALATAAAAVGATSSKSSVPHGPYDRYIAPEMKDYTHLYRVGHMLLMPTSVNKSVQKLFILDSGAALTSIAPETAREVTKVYRDDRLQIHGVSGAVQQVYTANDVTLNFGGIEQPGRNVVTFDTSSLSGSVGLAVSGFIGATTLDQLTTHIDYRDGLVKFDYDPQRGYRPVR